MQRPMSESEFVLMARRLEEAQAELDLNRRTRDAANKSLREERDEARADAEQAQLRSDAIVRDANKALADMRAEVKRLRADLHTSEASRAGNIERAEFLSGELEKAEDKLKAVVKALERIISTTPGVAREKVHVVRIKRIAEAALAAAEEKS